MQARTKNTVHEQSQVFVFLFKNETREIILSRVLLEAFFDEEYRRISTMIQILRDKLFATPCNDTEREATMTAYNLFQADLAEVSARIHDSEIREERAAVREIEERAAIREKEERAADREERAAVRKERAAVREMEERAAVREILRQNQEHETLLNFSKEGNQIFDAIRAVHENLTAASSEAERQRLESLLADLRTQHSISLAQHEAYRKQGMATSL